MATHKTIEARSTEVGPSSANQSGNWFVAHWRLTVLGLGGLAAGATAVVALMGGPSEVSTGITSHLPQCGKNDAKVGNRSFQQPGAEVDVQIGDSEDKKVQIEVVQGADVNITPSPGLIDITTPGESDGLSQPNKLRTYRLGQEVRTIIAFAAPNGETELIISKPC